MLTVLTVLLIVTSLSALFFYLHRKGWMGPKAGLISIILLLVMVAYNAWQEGSLSSEMIGLSAIILGIEANQTLKHHKSRTLSEQTVV